MKFVGDLTYGSYVIITNPMDELVPVKHDGVNSIVTVYKQKGYIIEFDSEPIKN